MFKMFTNCIDVYALIFLRNDNIDVLIGSSARY